MLWQIAKLGGIYDVSRTDYWPPDRLHKEATRRANVLVANGVRPGSRVAILHGNSASFCADLFAVWSAGGVAIPLDPALTPFELRNIVDYVKPHVTLISNDKPAADIPFVDLALQTVDSNESVSASVSPDDPALIFFTSGTTGAPKGVVLSHRALLTRVSINVGEIGSLVLARTLVTLPTSFGHGLIGNLLTPLYSGADVVFGPAGLDLARTLGPLVDEHRISFLSSVPALWLLAMKTSKPPRAGTLRRVHVGSAPLAADLWRKISRFCSAEVVNTYGMTEAANWISGASGNQEIADGLVGRPWGCQAAILDDNGQIAYRGVGEILVSTPSLMAGYLDRPDLTESVLWDGWLRTGDSGEIDEAGRIWLKGRIKDEINRSGFKIQPAEIDALLQSHPAVEEACAFPLPDQLGGELLAAAIKFRPGQVIEFAKLRDWCLKHVRTQAVPERWFVANELPRTARGKLRRDNLSAIFGSTEG